MKYIDLGSCIQRDDGVMIPRDPANRDYAAFLQWVAAGNEPGDPEPVPPAVPSQVTMRQARLALLAAQKLDLVDAAIAALPSPQREVAHIEWEYGAIVERSSPVVAMLSVALALDLDELFLHAASL